MSAKKTVKKLTRARAIRRASAGRGRGASGQGKVGSSFEDMLKETGDFEAVKAKAIKRVLAWQISEAMSKGGLGKAEMAKRMETSRSQLDRLLDPDNDDMTLATLARAAAALGRGIRLELV
jgi:antitoxin HicB